MNTANATAKWTIGLLVSILLFVGGFAAKGIEGRVTKMESHIDAEPEYVTLQQQLVFAMEHNSVHIKQSEDLAAINAKLDIVLRELGIGSVQ
jgi:hypothetical protein